MSHTIINPEVPVKIDSEHVIWGYIRSKKDIGSHIIALDDLAEIRDRFKIGHMTFMSNGSVNIDISY